MPSTSKLFDDFFAPLANSLTTCKHRRHCKSISDFDWLRIGVLRALQDHPSGRAYLQHLDASPSVVAAPDVSHFFESLKSSRRLALCIELNGRLTWAMNNLVPDALAALPALQGFDLYAGDGHYHAAAAHDRREPAAAGSGEGREARPPVGHFFTLNLRTHALSHLTGADSLNRQHEHDMRALKRLEADTLRHHAPKGRKVIYVWDRAGIDFRAWYNWKQSAGLYFISRQKDNMKLDTLAVRPVDGADALNTGVLRDELVGSSNGVQLRRITYRDELSETEYVYLTNEMTLPPGIIAHLYKMRWDIEKVFDELKNKLGETKAWASSATAKDMQAQFLCLAHNLLLIMEHDLERDHGIRNEAEFARRAGRLEQAKAALKKRGLRLPMLHQIITRLTQRSVKFIRWLRSYLFSLACYDQALTHLRKLYAVL